MTDHELTDDEKRLRDALIMQARGAQNCAPGSPLYDKVMGTNLYVVKGDPVFSKRAREQFAGKNIDWVVIDECHDEVKPLLKLILRQALYSLLVMFAVGVGVAVFL